MNTIPTLEPPFAPRHSRRRHLQLLAAALTGGSWLGLSESGWGDELPSTLFDFPITGEDDPRLRSFDRLIASFIALHEIPGAAVAVTKDSRLVYARGFGFADMENRELVQPASLFRIASLSKPITAVAVLQLVEQGKLKLDEKAFELLKTQPHLEEGKKEDPRFKAITVRQLLQHTAGWDREKSFEPMVGESSIEIAKKLGAEPPAMQKQIIQYMAGQPLDFAPGERYAYSNFGYCVLGRLIEAASGQPYDAYVREHVLKPLGITRMKLGKTMPEDRAEHEVKYYDNERLTKRAVMGDKIGKRVLAPYGAWCLEAMDSHGGWISSAIDLVRFASAFDRPAECKILSQKSIETMFTRPNGKACEDEDGNPARRYYGCGWSVVEVVRGRMNQWHLGELDGTATLLVRRADGLNWAVLFNKDEDVHGENLGAAIDTHVHVAADHVTEWPANDQFEKLL